MSERNVRITLEYDGTRFHGWQVQPDKRTVQGEVERALEVLLKHPVRVRVAGRTDAGVHAKAQVCSVFTTSTIELGILLRGLNGVMPRDVAALDVREVDERFEPRFAACGKRYRYRILHRQARPVLQRYRCWHIHRPLDIEAMAAALEALCGTHDFSSFRAAKCAARSPVKELRVARLSTAKSPYLDITFEGSGFLKQMIRILVGTVVEVGLGRRCADQIPDLLAACDRSLAGRTAPAAGLTMMEVFYDEE